MDILPFVFKLWKQSPRIKQILGELTPAAKSLRAVWPEAAPLLRDWVKITDKLLYLLTPVWADAKKVWPRVKPALTEVLNDVAPDMLEQWDKEPALPFMSVRWVQQFMNDEGYTPKLKVDGDWGPATDEAVKWYQKKKGLGVDGRIGRETLTAMLGSTSK